MLCPVTSTASFTGTKFESPKASLIGCSQRATELYGQNVKMLGIVWHFSSGFDGWTVFWAGNGCQLYPQLPVQIAPRSGIKDDTQKEIKVETKAEDKAVENFQEVATWILKTRPGHRGPHENYPSTRNRGLIASPIEGQLWPITPE